MWKKLIFPLRLIAYIFVALIMPCIYMISKYKLFQRTDKISIGIWGSVLILFVFIFVWCLISSLRKGMKFGLAKQCLDGICKITIPLIAAILIINFMDSLADRLIEILIAICVCNTVAIPINPIPKWRIDNQIEQGSNIIAIGIEKVKEKLKK